MYHSTVIYLLGKIKDPCRAVVTCGDHARVIWAHGEIKNALGVSVGNFLTRRRSSIPKSDGAVDGCAAMQKQNRR